MMIAGNPFGTVWDGTTIQNGIQLDTGSYSPWEVDISLPCPGPGWTVGRNYSAVQADDRPPTTAHIDSDGPQGVNWFQICQPEIVLYDYAPSQTDEEDLVYLVYGADRYAEYQRFDDDSNEFRGRNGAAGVFEKVTESGVGFYVLTDQHGTKYTFFDPSDSNAGEAQGQLWKIKGATTDFSYVGHPTDITKAIDDGYVNASGNLSHGAIAEAYDSAGRRYVYTYTSGRLTEVKAQTKTGGTWHEDQYPPLGVGTLVKVNYGYYGQSETYGDDGALKTVTLTTTLSETGKYSTRTKYYRYWTGSFNDSTNPGYPYALKYVLDWEGARGYDYEDDSGNFNQSFATAGDSYIEPYASAYLEYDSSHRIDVAWFNGGCGCTGGGADGTHEYAYSSNGSHPGNTGYDVDWARSTMIEQPNGSILTQYFDELGQGLHQVLTDVSNNRWVTGVARDGSGLVTSVHTPANVTSYSSTTGLFTASSTVGLVRTYTYVGSGDMCGFLEHVKYQEGTGNDEYYLRTQEYSSETLTIDTDLAVARPVVSSTTEYPTAVDDPNDSTDETTTSYAYTSWYSGTLMPEIVKTTWPAVSIANNGSGSSEESFRHYYKSGRLGFEASRGGTITYREYTDGNLTKLIEDADTTQDGQDEDFYNVDFPGEGTLLENDFKSSGTTVHKVTEYAYGFGGNVGVTLPDASQTRILMSRLDDERVVSLRYARYDASAETFYGPVGFAVINHAGKAEVVGQIALSGGSSDADIDDHVDEDVDDPIAAMDGLTGSGAGAVCQLTSNHYDDTGKRLEGVRVFHTIPSAMPTTEPPVADSNCDATVIEYDASGRLTKTTDPTGTFRTTEYDSIGRAAARAMGTDDEGVDFNMVTVEELEYDGDAAGGNGDLTKRTLYLDDTGLSTRVWEYQYDARGNLLVEESPESPHVFYQYDNLGRRVATGLFSSLDTLPSAPTVSSASTRLALSETDYDELGRAWKTIRYKIGQGTGEEGDKLDTLESEYWFDADGRVIKTDGSQLTKTFYDGLGRVTNGFILAADNDSGTYAAASTVAGDDVLEEHQTVYDTEDGNVVMRVSIDRHHYDGSGDIAGALDLNDEDPPDPLTVTASDIEGRAQITAYWYDDLDRLVDVVEYGTNGGLDFERDGLTAPTRDGEILRNTYSYGYNETGDWYRWQEVRDPMGRVHRTIYDPAGRLIKEIRNYDSNENGGEPDDDNPDINVTIRYEYQDGLQSKIVEDLEGTTNDQTTRYVYGTAEGAPADSKIATGHLLRAVVYPDSKNPEANSVDLSSDDIDTDDSDVVSYCYNAQCEPVVWKDQTGLEHRYYYDGAGRLQETYLSFPIGSDFDDAVMSVQTEYDDLGRAETVTQYGGDPLAVRDQVAFSYDDWGNLGSFEQDVDSVIDGGGIDEYSVSYSWEKATTGRNTIRRDTMTMPSGTEVDYNYRSAGGCLDEVVSRVTYLEHDGTVAAAYSYNGLGHVVGTRYYAIDVVSNYFDSSTPPVYDGLDDHNRVVKSRWTKDLEDPGVDFDFYSVDVAHDANSNITVVEDNVHEGFDVLYSIDEINRLECAQEGDGSWSGTPPVFTVNTESREESWDLDPVGNWTHFRRDLDGDGYWNNPDELNEDRMHNTANELESRDFDNSAPPDYAYGYDDAGNMISDSLEDYTFEYDGFYRLRKVLNDSEDSVAEYRYNGLGYRIAERVDADLDGIVSDDTAWRYFVYDDEWRVVAEYLDEESADRQTEEYVYHSAGLDGLGGSSYIDLVVLRTRDSNASGSMDETLYYCQNWRADISALVDDDGMMKEWVKYSSYGVPFGIPAGDTNSDGKCILADVNQINSWSGTDSGDSGFDVRGDADLDGDIDGDDRTIAGQTLMGTQLGRWSISDVENRRGYAGYGLDERVELYHIRNRVLSPELGRWLRRDPEPRRPLGMLYSYVAASPLCWLDPQGLFEIPTGLSGSLWPGTGGDVGVANALPMSSGQTAGGGGVDRERTIKDCCDSACKDSKERGVTVCCEVGGAYVKVPCVCDGNGTNGAMRTVEKLSTMAHEMAHVADPSAECKKGQPIGLSIGYKGVTLLTWRDRDGNVVAEITSEYREYVARAVQYAYLKWLRDRCYEQHANDKEVCDAAINPEGHRVKGEWDSAREAFDKKAASMPGRTPDPRWEVQNQLESQQWEVPTDWISSL